MKGNKIGALERAPCPRNTKIYIFDKFPTFPHGFFSFFSRKTSISFGRSYKSPFAFIKMNVERA